MKLVTYNIQFGRGRDGRIDLPRIARAVEAADIIALQEIDRHWPRSGDVDQLRELAQLLPAHYHVFGAGVDLHAADAAPPDNRRRQFGNALFSRYPIISMRHHLLPKTGSIGPPSIQRSAVETTIRVGNKGLRVYSLHLTHLSAATRMPQVKHLQRMLRDAATQGAPISGELRGLGWDGVESQEVPADAILLGDFNFQPDSAEYARFVGPWSNYGGRITPPNGFVDAWLHAGNDDADNAGVTSTVRGKPARIDYAFVAAGLRTRIKACFVDQKADGSDHQPLWLELTL